MSPAPRKPKYHPPPPPPSSPKILLFPRTCRTRRKQPKTTIHTHRRNGHPPLLSYKGKLDSLFDREHNDSPILPLESLDSSTGISSGLERRERVEGRQEEAGCGHCNGGGFEEEKWRFEAEILTAECKFLRLEREFALKKLEKNRIQMETTLRSAVQTLVSGRNKIYQGQDTNALLVEVIEDLAQKLQDLQKTLRIKDYEFPKCRNMDTKACLLQRRLEKLGVEISSPKELQELIDQSSQSINYISPDRDKDPSSIKNCEIKNNSTDVNVLRKTMDMLDRSDHEEYRSSYVYNAVNSSVSSSASTYKRTEFPELYNTQFYQEQVLHDNKCSGHCKAVIWRIVEQVRAETEQWSQIQEMLKQVRGEMEELQTSRHFWKSQAYSSDYEIQSLSHMVQEWKDKALDYENKIKELSLEVTVLKEEVRKSKAEPYVTQELQGCEFRNALKELRIVGKTEKLAHYKDWAPPLSLGKQLAREMEKRMMLHRLKENNSPTCKKSTWKSPSNDRMTRRSTLTKIGSSTSLRHEKLNWARYKC